MPSLASRYPLAPFDESLPTHPLLVISYPLIKARDPVEVGRLFEACSTIGFFYLSGHEVADEPMFEMGEATFALPEEELLKFEQVRRVLTTRDRVGKELTSVWVRKGDNGSSAGYKKAGNTNVDK